MPPMCEVDVMFLAFDPAVSLHYEVFLFQKEVPPRVPEPPTWVDLEQTYLPRLFGEEQLSEEEEEEEEEEQEEEEEEDNLDVKHIEVSSLDQLQKDGVKDPKEKVVPLTVYSSRTGNWENREFTPGCCAPGHLYDMVMTNSPDGYVKMWSSEYWHASLYVHCHNCVLMILRLSKCTYDMVRLPGEPYGRKGVYSLPESSILASYERGIHYVAVNQWQLQVWTLNESACGQLGWTLAHMASLNLHSHIIDDLTTQPRVRWGVAESSDKLVSSFKDSYYGESICSEDIFHNNMTEDDNFEGVKEEKERDDNYEVVGEEEGDEVEEEMCGGGSQYSWNSDEDNFIPVDESANHLGPPAWRYCAIMGFHPHKNAFILLLQSSVVVYHLDTLRMQYLGDDYELVKDNMQQACCAYRSFPYRPCYVDVLPAEKLSRSPF
ncbi:hypothetical protein VPH35_047897 [Triticum aestivum]